MPPKKDPSFRIPEKGDRGAVIRRCRSAALQAARFLLGANSAVSGNSGLPTSPIIALITCTDLSMEVQKQQKQYNGMKQQLRELNIDFGLVFLAKMRIFYQSSQHLFLTQVEEFIQ
ncbi:hypothetical protein ABVT39_025997 [Epinephelus coioides]